MPQNKKSINLQNSEPSSAWIYLFIVNLYLFITNNGIKSKTSKYTFNFTIADCYKNKKNKRGFTANIYKYKHQKYNALYVRQCVALKERYVKESSW